ncbi:small subunit ribosomal protein S25e [Strigomonas culicis]|uniref:40S ribosomal protein S25 n=1 Tax=Strigomonas culicis TaxID=28005 RepID=S9UN36_9TRYP|nr:small subunit ribosomal protein S25e [Strigomonas culicis]|eukprot:EPY30348.1 small subunit ribosomal protein S25e [Strigomonas culicis]
MPPKAGQTKKAKMEAAQKGGKKATKKWTKGHSREKLDNAVMFDKETYDKLRSEVPKYRLITPNIISDRLKISVSLAGNGLKQLCRERLIRLVSVAGKHRVYTRVEKAEEKPAAAPAAAAAEAPAKEAKAKSAKVKA